MSSAGKKKGGGKVQYDAEGTAGVLNVQNPFLSAAHKTLWPYDASAHNRGGCPIFTAAANAICGRPNGTYDCSEALVHFESPACTRTFDEVLPASEAWAAERALQARLQITNSPLESCFAACSDFVASPSLTPGHDILYEDWLHHTAAYRMSPLQYPHHVICVKAPATASSALPGCATNPCQAFVQVATVLHQLLATYLHRCNTQLKASVHDAHERVPSYVFASLLGNAVYNTNFSEPPLEQKDTTFGWVESPGQGVSNTSESGVPLDGLAATRTASVNPVTAHMEKMRACQPNAPPRRYDTLSVVSCVDAAHINVCVGQHFYKLCVMNKQEGRLRCVAALAADLEVLHEHHLSLAHKDVLPDASPAARQDRQDLDTMFANLSCVADEIAFDVRRRLRVSSEVNAYSLDVLESGLCTLVLREDDTVSEFESPGTHTLPVAQWLHSVCCLETSLSHPEQWTMRLQALVVPLQAGLEWVRSALTQPSGAVSTEDVANHLITLDTGGEAGGPADQGPTLRKMNPASHELSTRVDAYGNVEHLELWLPQKHRVPLKPYAAPVWNRADAQHPLSDISSCACTLVDFCMCLLRLTAEWKRDDRLSTTSQTRRWQPRVVVAVQPPRGGAPSLIALDMPSIQHFYEVLASPPLLFAVDTRHRVEAEARSEVAALLNIAWYTTSTVRTPLKDESKPRRWFEGTEATADGALKRADVCVSFAVLPRHAAPLCGGSTQAPVVSRLLSDLAVPSSLLVNCAAQQTAAEVHVRASESTLVDVVVGADAPATAPLVGEFAAALASCVRGRHSCCPTSETQCGSVDR
ncbi:hypothetical protein, conserved [Leishmania tarentolae]|uniref:Uncharacterized protein n=1 Tax=Leishmania tarentolae TaxID=5689 RepID=A0A640KL33_LEITA|nr:hypothetical protein, conserved [Leishmania tarentolae]